MAAGRVDKDMMYGQIHKHTDTTEGEETRAMKNKKKWNDQIGEKERKKRNDMIALVFLSFPFLPFHFFFFFYYLSLLFLQAMVQNYVA